MKRLIIISILAVFVLAAASAWAGASEQIVPEKYDGQSDAGPYLQGLSWESATDPLTGLTLYSDTPHDEYVAGVLYGEAGDFDIGGAEGDKYLIIHTPWASATVEWDLRGLAAYTAGWVIARLQSVSAGTLVRLIFLYDGSIYETGCFTPSTTELEEWGTSSYYTYLTDGCNSGECWAGVEVCPDSTDSVYVQWIIIDLLEGTLPVELDRLEAFGISDGIMVEWETSMETDNFGWNIYRSEEEFGAFKKINQETLAPYQYLYNYVDNAVEPGVRYYYKLQRMELSGADQEYGPVYASAGQAGGESGDRDVSDDADGGGDGQATGSETDSEDGGGCGC